MRVSSEQLPEPPTSTPDHGLRIVENTGARMFGLEEAEVMERRRYVSFVRREIDVRILPSGSYAS